MCENFEGTSHEETLFPLILFPLSIQALSLSDPEFTVNVDVSDD